MNFIGGTALVFEDPLVFEPVALENTSLYDSLLFHKQRMIHKVFLLLILYFRYLTHSPKFSSPKSKFAKDFPARILCYTLLWISALKQHYVFGLVLT